MIRLARGSLRQDGPINHEAAALVRIIADFELIVDKQVVYAEPDVPVLELAVELGKWLKRGMSERHGFTYNSMEAERPLLSFSPVEPEQWKIEATLQQGPAPSTVSSSDLSNAIEDFVSGVSDDAESKFGISVGQFMRREDPPSRRQ